MKRIEKNHKEDEELEDDEEYHPSSEPESEPSVFVDEEGIINTGEEDLKPTSTELTEKNVSKKKWKKRRKKPPSSKNRPIEEDEEEDEEEIHDDHPNVSPGAVLDGGHSSSISRKWDKRRRRKKKDKIIVTLKQERQGHSPMKGDKRAAKRTRHRMTTDESDEEGGISGESDSEDSMDQPGASAIPGVGRHVMGHPSTTDGTVMYSMGGGSNHSNLENVPEDEAGDDVQVSTRIYDGEINEEHLVQAELAPDIEIVEGTPMEEGEDDSNNRCKKWNPYLLLAILGVVVVIAVIVIPASMNDRNTAEPTPARTTLEPTSFNSPLPTTSPITASHAATMSPTSMSLTMSPANPSSPSIATPSPTDQASLIQSASPTASEVIIISPEKTPTTQPSAIQTTSPTTSKIIISPDTDPPTSAPSTTSPSVMPSSMEPTNGPTLTPNPTMIPTLSPMPSISPTITPAPTITSQPSTMQPTTCLEYLTPYLVPPLIETLGAFVNPLPDGAVSYVKQDSDRVTIRVTQLWSSEPVVWIAGYYYSDGEEVICPKTRNVGPGEELDYDVKCDGDGVGLFNVAVNDDSLTPGWGFQMPSDCGADDGIDDKVVFYRFEAQCNPPPFECDDNEVVIT